MLCPHCGKEIVTPAYADPVNAVTQTIFLPNVNAATGPGIQSTVANGSHLWLNACAGAGADAVTFHYTVDGNGKR